METMETDSEPKTRTERSGKATRKRQSLSHFAMLNPVYHGRELKSEFLDAFTKRDAKYEHGKNTAKKIKSSLLNFVVSLVGPSCP